jgi:acetylornithine deacetylase/succinyl-diaminopimelate desuccinylase-like protein
VSTREHTFHIGDAPRLEVSIASGEIRLRNGAAGTISLTVESPDVDQVEVTRTGDTVIVRRPNSWGGRRRRVTLVASVPPGTDIDIGAVTEVQGIAWYEVTITGQSNHAGTTPIAHRHDPLYAASRIAVHVRELCSKYGSHQVGTVGKIDVHPNLVNVVPARATFTVDLRNTDAGALRLAEVDLWRFCDHVAAAERVHVDVKRLARFDPVPFHPHVVEWVEATATDLGHSVRQLPSGAGHDAQMFARVCPAGMIFVPSVGGISHNPAEHTEPADLTAGADTLLQTLLGIAGVASVGGAPVGPGWDPVLDHPRAPEDQ